MPRQPDLRARNAGDAVVGCSLCGEASCQPSPTAAGLVAAGWPAVAQRTRRGEQQGFLETIHRHITRTSTVTDNGDLNPYADRRRAGLRGQDPEGRRAGDNFNNVSNLQGTGATIVDYNPCHQEDDAVRQAAAAPAAMPRRRRPRNGDDDAQERLGDRRQHAQHATARPAPRATAACSCSTPTASWPPPGPVRISTARGATWR